MAALGSRRLGAVGDALLIGLIVALGAVLRLADPLSSTVIPAEDPYNHMALVREHVRRGDIESLNPQGDVYPPGLHAYLAAVWVQTGADLYWIFRFGPVILGAVSVLGVCLVLRRFQGRVAVGVGGLAMAVAPEEIFRTSMMSPTALDLAVLPFLLLAFLEVLRGRLAWTAVAAPLTFFYVFAHPWILGLLAAAGLAFLAMSFLLPWSLRRGPPLSAAGVAALTATVAASLAVALSRCNGLCGPAFTNVGGIPYVDRLSLLTPPLVVIAVTGAWVAAAGARRMQPRLDRWGTRSRRTATNMLWSIAIAAVLAAGSYAAIRPGLPRFVDLIQMLGWPILTLAAAGLLLLPFASRPLPYASAALAIATLPLVVFNPFQSSFLPHRTAVFLGLAACLLAGVAAGFLSAQIARAISSGSLMTARNARATRWRKPMALAGALGIALAASGSVYAATPNGYTWYRMFNECEFDGLRDVAAKLDDEPRALHISPDWQSKMVLAALAEDASRIWYKADFFYSARERARVLDAAEREQRPVYVTLDRYADASLHDAFRMEGPWHAAGTWCESVGAPIPRIALFVRASVPEVGP